LTPAEIRARLRVEKKLKVATTSIWRFYDRNEITFKKNLAGPRQRRASSTTPLDDDDVHGGLRIDGTTAPYVIDGSMDGPAFLAYVEQVLAPTLHDGCIVFMDNLRTHKVDGVAVAIAAVGTTVRCLPA
jgi:hypothetical protein